MNPFHWIHRAIDSTGPISGILDLAGRVQRPSVPRVAQVSRPPSPKGTDTARRVSVIVPTFNYARFLPESVGSALTQTDVDVEVVVVDDASTDETELVTRELAHDDGRVQVFRNEYNLGHVRTFNAGLRLATGEFVVRLDADDLLAPGSLSRAVALLTAYPNVGLVYGHPRHFTHEQARPLRTGRPSWTVWRGEDWLKERCRTGVNCITTPEAMVRRSVLQEVGGLRTELRFAQDFEMWLRIATVSDVGRIGGVDQALHREHATSMSMTDGAAYLTDLAERRRAFELSLQVAPYRSQSVQQLHTLARRALARDALARTCHLYERHREHTEPVDDYVAFALDVYPLAAELPEWVLLQKHQSRAVVSTRWAFGSLLPSLQRRARSELAYLRWTRQGV